MSLALPGPLLLVGAGKMGGALLTGWLEQGLDPASIFIQDPEPAPEIGELAAAKGVSVAAEQELPRAPAVILLAVKPQIMDAALPPLKAHAVAGAVFLSIAAGRTMAGMAAHLGEGAAIVRAMPNTPAAIGRGITAACPNAHVSAERRGQCDSLLSAVGEVVWLDEEGLLDAVTAVSGSGPAYVFLLAECLAEAGVAAGLDEKLAMRLARATVSGAGELLRQSELDPGVLRENVTSPGGTTAAALEVLMDEGGFRALLERAVAKAAARSRELSS